MALAVVVRCDQPACEAVRDLGHVTYTFAFGTLQREGWRWFDGGCFCPACSAALPLHR